MFGLRFFLIFAVIVYGIFATTDYKAKLVKKAKTLATTYLSDDQLDSFIEKITDEAWAGKTTSQIAQDMIPWALQEITPTQYAEIFALYNTFNSQFGSSNKTWTCINEIINVGSQYIEPYKDNIYNQWASMNATSTQQACYNKAWQMAAGYLVKANILPAVNALKADFTANTCQIGYNNLNKKYVLLDVYKFSATPCTGTIEG